MRAETVYANDFLLEVGDEWSHQARTVTPAGARSFLGPFTNESVVLSLVDLPTHADVTISYDLFLLGTWDGSAVEAGPDRWRISVEGGTTLLETTFNAFFNPPDRQAFPGAYPGADFPAHSGAREVGTLGFSYEGFGVLDSVYRMTHTFPHSGETLVLDFRGIGLQAPTDESWGLTNVLVTVPDSSGTPFRAWMAANHPGITATDDDPEDDPDGDGLNNFGEFSVAGDPEDPRNRGQHSHGIRTLGGTDYLTWTFASREGSAFSGIGPVTAQRDGITYSVRAGSDLATYALGLEPVVPALTETLPTLPSGYRYETFRVIGGTDARPEAFLQLQVAAYESTPPAGFARIPGGEFPMGNALPTAEGDADELPLHMVNVGAFVMEKTLVSKARWDDVRAWGATRGYTDLPVGGGKASNHPVQDVSWQAAVKWCNARSEMEGLTPTYFANATKTLIYRSGEVDLLATMLDMGANGYRLPTEAEWEKAARGGLPGLRFPWGDTISHAQANYISDSAHSYDVSLTRGDLPTYAGGGQPYTSPVGVLAVNAFGLHDMAGNVWQWCWDRYGDGYYSNSPGLNPLGSMAGSTRVIRGGSCLDQAPNCRVASRNHFSPTSVSLNVGFRVVRRNE